MALRFQLVSAAFVLLKVGVWPALAEAEPVATPEVEIEGAVTSRGGDASEDRPRVVRGRMTISGWQAGGEGCLYLPYEDPNYGEERGTKRRFETFSARGEVVQFGGGKLMVEPRPPARLGQPDPAYVLRVSWPAGTPLTLDFVATVPRLPGVNPDEWFYDGFLPRLLASCPAAGLEPEYYRVPLAVRYQGALTVPGNWRYVGPGEVRSATDGRAQIVTFDQTARSIAFALGRRLRHETMQVAGVPIDVYHLSEGFDGMARVVERTLPALIAQLGPFPYPSLKILETTELQSHGLPGLIAINRPAQAAFSQAQSDWLHWREWILTLQLARQWYGGAVAAASPDDEWLIAGIADYATLEALSTDPESFDLFGKRQDGSRLLSFDYLQFAGISASLLLNKAPFARLTNQAFESTNSLARQHPLLFAKQVFTLRQLAGTVGSEPFRAFLRSLTTSHAGGFLAPKDFARHLLRIPSPFSAAERQALETYLTQWWTGDGWPNFSVADLDVTKTTDGRYRAAVTAEQQGDFTFPPMIGVTDEVGRTSYARAIPGERPDVWTATIETAAEPALAVVDPLRETYDADRFDNASSWTDLAFFPGTANTLRDDAYTIGWFPYAFRRPGEPASMGLQVALLRYLQSGLFVRIEGSPQEDVAAAEARHTFQIPSHALNGLVALKQNYDHEREAEASISRFPLVDLPVHVGLGVKARHKELPGIEASAHQTAGLGLLVKPAARSRICGYSFEAEIEHAPRAWTSGFTYERKSGIAMVDCNLTRRVNLALRGFGGALYAEGVPPEQAFFKPTELKEARLRLDLRGLARARKLTAAGVDLSFPFYVPLPTDAMLLARQMRWRLFVDHGHSYDDDVNYRSYGGGFTLPFGGDLAGAGSLAFTRVTVLAIVESRSGAQVAKRPSLVFDVTGEL